MGGTLAEKVWDDHVVRRAEGEPDLLAKRPAFKPQTLPV